MQAEKVAQQVSLTVAGTQARQVTRADKDLRAQSVLQELQELVVEQTATQEQRVTVVLLELQAEQAELVPVEHEVLQVTQAALVVQAAVAS